MTVGVFNITSQERIDKIEKINEDIKELEGLRRLELNELEELKQLELNELALESKALINFLHKEKVN